MNMTESSKENPLHSDGVRGYEPENKLRGILGADVDLRRDVFTPEKIAKSQQVIDKAVENYFADTIGELDAIAHACSTIEKGDANASDAAKTISEIAQRMKGQSETLGFVLIAKVSSSLHRFCTEQFEGSQQSATIIRKHVDSLRVAFAQELKGDGGAMGAELTSILEKLIAKFSRKA